MNARVKSDPTANRHDVIILGGGPAGMAAALVAGRARLRTLVINEGKARNLVTTASHGFLTRDGAHPSELAAAALAQLKKYPTVTTTSVRASAVQSTDDGFTVEGDDGSQWHGRRIIVATGFRDDLDKLSIPGVDAVYGKTVYPCPFCDGFEHADEKLAVFMAEGVEHFVPVVRMWSEDIIVFTNGRKLTEPQKAALRARGVGVEESAIAHLESDGGVLRAVVLLDGKRVEREAGFVGDDFSVEATTFAADLGVKRSTNAWGMEVLEADDAGATAAGGVFVVGDAKSGFGGITASVAEGSACAEGIVHAIAAERWQAAAAETGPKQ